MNKRNWKILGGLGVVIALLPMILISGLKFYLPRSLSQATANLIIYSSLVVGIILAIIGSVKSR